MDISLPFFHTCACSHTLPKTTVAQNRGTGNRNTFSSVCSLQSKTNQPNTNKQAKPSKQTKPEKVDEEGDKGRMNKVDRLEGLLGPSVPRTLHGENVGSYAGAG